MSDRLTTGIAHRLGWSLYWVLAGLSVGWILGFLLLNWGEDWWQSLNMWLVLVLPPLLLYGLARFVRTLLSDE